MVALLCVVAAVSVIGQKKNLSPKEERREVREERRAQRLAEYEKMMDSLVLSRNFQFNPQTMQRQPAGPMRTILNPEYSVGIWGSVADICLPYIKGYTPPYYPVIFNYVLSSVQGYTVEQTDYGWHVTFQSTMFTATTFTFSFEIYSHYGGATLTISSPFYNSMQYTGNIFGI